MRRIQRDISPLRSPGMARVVTISRQQYDILVDPSNVGADWVGESQSRVETASSKLVKVTIPTNEIYAAPKATQSLIDDSSIDLAAWLVESVSVAFALKEGTAFAAGDGVLKPMAFLSYPLDSADDFVRTNWASVQYVPTGATSPTADQLSNALVALSMKLRVPYRPNARWLMNRDSARIVRQLKDAQGRFLWSSDGRMIDSVADRLLGFAVEYDESMPSVGANATPIAIADWNQAYTIVDRIGIRVLRDPYTSKPYVSFYTTKRVGGSMVDFNALKLLRYSVA